MELVKYIQAYMDFFDEETLPSRTLFMFAEKYLASFIMENGSICDNETGIIYEIDEDGYGLSLRSTFNSETDIPEGVILFRITGFGNFEISIATINNGVLTYETFCYDESYENNYVIMQTMICGRQQVKQLLSLIISERESLYYSIIDAIDKPSALIEGVYNIKDSGVVQSFTVSAEIPSLSIEQSITYTGVKCIMDPYHLHQLYIEEKNYLPALLEDQTVR